MILCFTVLLCLFTNLSHFTIILFCTLLMWFHIRIETYLKKVLLNLCIMSLVWRSIQHNNTTPLVRFLFFWNFTIGQTGSNMFCWISQNCEEIIRINFLCGRTGWTLFWNKHKGGFLVKIWHLWPLEIGGFGDKHPHDSDHAECYQVCLCLLDWRCQQIIRL